MKKVQVVWTDNAVNDLEIIYDFIAEQSPASAQKIISGILSRTRQLESFPGSGPIFEIKTRTGKTYRYLVEGHYKIIYSEASAVLYIESVFDTRQGPEKGKP